MESDMTYQLSTHKQESLRKKWSSPHSQQKILKFSIWVQSQSDRMILVCLQGKPINITVMQFYAPTTTVEESEVD